MTGETTSGAARTTVATFESYPDAERAVDFLSDREFPVERAAIVGTGLKTVEQIAGRLTTGRAALVGAGQGYTGDENGNPVIRNLLGVHAETQIDPQAYGMSPFFTAPIPIVIDAEFARQE